MIQFPKDGSSLTLSGALVDGSGNCTAKSVEMGCASFDLGSGVTKICSDTYEGCTPKDIIMSSHAGDPSFQFTVATDVNFVSSFTTYSCNLQEGVR
jgi:hypothetical protein